MYRPRFLYTFIHWCSVGCFPLRLLWIILLWTLVYKHLFNTLLSIFLSIYKSVPIYQAGVHQLDIPGKSSWFTHVSLKNIPDMYGGIQELIFCSSWRSLFATTGIMRIVDSNLLLIMGQLELTSHFHLPSFSWHQSYMCATVTVASWHRVKSSCFH